MKTLVERTEILLEELMYCDFRTEVGTDKGRTLIRRAMKDQDKTTRQDCAVSTAKVESIPFVSMDPNVNHVIKEHVFQAIKNGETN